MYNMMSERLQAFETSPHNNNNSCCSNYCSRTLVSAKHPSEIRIRNLEKDGSLSRFLHEIFPPHDATDAT